jgi:FMN phosphatase YigB (HAD superfamily)
LGAVKNPRRIPASEILIATELGRDSRIFDERDVIRLLKQAIEREGDQGAFARHHGIDRGYLNLISNEKRPINKAVLRALGLRKVFAPE